MPNELNEHSIVDVSADLCFSNSSQSPPPPPPPPPLLQLGQSPLRRADSQPQLQIQAFQGKPSGQKKTTEYNFLTTKNSLISKDISSFRPLMDTIETTYWAHKTRSAMSLDLIAMYLKGQKILYIESKSHCEYFLNVLMIPAICVSAICTVLSVSSNDFPYGNYIVSSLTALNSFILAMISYLKLDAKAESHRVTAYKFDKLQTKCEFFSGKIMHYSDTRINQLEEITKQFDEFIEDLEKNIGEIKEINQFIIPAAIRYRYPVLYSTNIFAEIKKKRNILKIKTNHLNIVYNKISEIQLSTEHPSKEEKLKELNSIKEALIHDSISFNSEILGLDTILSKEIERYIEYRRQKKWYHCILNIFCCRTKKYKINENESVSQGVQTI